LKFLIIFSKLLSIMD